MPDQVHYTTYPVFVVNAVAFLDPQPGAKESATELVRDGVVDEAHAAVLELSVSAEDVVSALFEDGHEAARLVGFKHRLFQRMYAELTAANSTYWQNYWNSLQQQH